VKRARNAGAKTALTRGVAVSFALGKLACSAPAPPPPKPQPPTTTTVAPTATATLPEPVPVVEAAPPPQDPSPLLAGYSVTTGSYARRVLYTWTSAEQIDELLRARVLLSRTESPKYGKSFYDRVMEERWLSGDKLAGLLRAPAFLKARFAWPAPWATLLGWPGEVYGGQLIEATLKPNAWIAMYRTSTKTWEVRDLQDKVVDAGEVLRRPDRLAAVHFVHDAVGPPAAVASTRPSAADGREAYREYVLCNESMIESWSVGTDRIGAEIAANADTVLAVAKYLEARPSPAQRADRWNAHVALLVWPGLVPASAPKELYELALAFPNTNYVPEPDALRKLADGLRALRQHGAATVHKPTMLFTGAKAPAIPPPPPPKPGRIMKRYGTY